ncbi:unnamed protein product, partial [Burkholderia pseudomallei]
PALSKLGDASAARSRLSHVHSG